MPRRRGKERRTSVLRGVECCLLVFGVELGTVGDRVNTHLSWQATSSSRNKGSLVKPTLAEDASLFGVPRPAEAIAYACARFLSK